MKFSTILPALASSAKKRESEKSQDRFAIDEITDLCLEIVPSLSGTFETTNDGFHGEINLDNYPSKIKCKHVVQADNSCRAIKVKYRSVAVEPATFESCNRDGFQIGWFEGTENFITSASCNCYGDGCDQGGLNFDGTSYDWFFDYYGNYAEEQLGPTEFTVNSNTFSFFFNSDDFVSHGHVVFD